MIPLKSAEHDLSFAASLAASLRTLPGRLLFLIDGLGEPRGAKRRGEARGLCWLFGVRRGVRGIRSHGVPIGEKRGLKTPGVGGLKPRKRGKPGEPGQRNIGRGSCRSALADGVERRSTAVRVR